MIAWSRDLLDFFDLHEFWILFWNWIFAWFTWHETWFAWFAWCEKCMDELLDLRLDLRDLFNVKIAWMNQLTWDLICMICLMWKLHGWITWLNLICMICLMWKLHGLIIWLETWFAWFAWCENCIDELILDLIWLTKDLIWYFTVSMILIDLWLAWF